MLRRAIGTTLAGLCAVTGPLAGSAVAATGPTLTTSVTSARPGVPFTLTPSAGCPSDAGVQSVDVSFTDSAGRVFPIGGAQTEDDGTWADLPVTLPVAGVQDDGTWAADGEATGAGVITATCSSADPGEDDPDSDQPDDPGDPDSPDEGLSAPHVASGDDGGSSDTGDTGDDSENPVVTQTYTGLSFVVSGSAGQLALSAAVVAPGDPVTVTPAEACPAPGATTAEVSLQALGEDDTSDDPNSDDPPVSCPRPPCRWPTTEPGPRSPWPCPPTWPPGTTPWP
jgi:hypothetical protein